MNPQAAAHSSITGLAFSANGKTVASGGWDGDIKLWDTRTWQEAATLRCSAGTVDSLPFLPTGRTLVSVHGSEGGPAEVWFWSADGEGRAPSTGERAEDGKR